jgi:hypothetical protein
MAAKRYWGPVVTLEFGVVGLAEKHRNPLPNVDVIRNGHVKVTAGANALHQLRKQVAAADRANAPTRHGTSPMMSNSPVVGGMSFPFIAM